MAGAGELFGDLRQRCRRDGPQQLVTDSPERLLRFPAVLLRRSSIPERDDVVHISHEDAVVSEIEQTGPFPQGFFGPPAFIDFCLQLLVGLLELCSPFPNPGFHLVARDLQRVFGPPSSGAERCERPRNEREHGNPRDVREIHGEAIDRRREVVRDRQRPEESGEQRRPEPAEPGGEQDSDQQRHLGIEGRLQPQRQ